MARQGIELLPYDDNDRELGLHPWLEFEVFLAESEYSKALRGIAKNKLRRAHSIVSGQWSATRPVGRDFERPFLFVAGTLESYDPQFKPFEANEVEIAADALYGFLAGIGQAPADEMDYGLGRGRRARNVVVEFINGIIAQPT